jgi:hypothetical protein
MLYMIQAGFPPIIRSSNCAHTHASGSSKQALHIPDAVRTVWAPDDGRKTRLKHVEHWQQYRILYNVASCWLNLKEYINDARYHERQIKYKHPLKK